MKNAVTLIGIFLSSYLVLTMFGCDKPITVKRVDYPNNRYNNYDIKFDKSKCEFEVKDAEPLTSPMDDPATNGDVCISKETYKKLSAKLKADCLNEKTNSKNVETNSEISTENRLH